MKNFFKNLWTKIQSWGRNQNGELNLAGVVGNIIKAPFIALWNAPRVVWFVVKNIVTRPMDMWVLASTIMVQMNLPEFGTVFGYIAYVMSMYSIMMVILGLVYLVMALFSVGFLPVAAGALTMAATMQLVLMALRASDVSDAIRTGLYHAFDILPSNESYFDSANIPHEVRIANLQTAEETVQEYGEEINQQAEEILERVAEESTVDPTLLDETITDDDGETPESTPIPRMSRGFANLEL